MPGHDTELIAAIDRLTDKLEWGVKVLRLEGRFNSRNEIHGNLLSGSLANVAHRVNVRLAEVSDSDLEEILDLANDIANIPDPPP
jgi:hypothetical protein